MKVGAALFIAKKIIPVIHIFVIIVNKNYALQSLSSRLHKHVAKINDIRERSEKENV